MTELNRRRPFFRPLSSQSVFTPAANARRTPARWPVGDEPSLEEMFADPIFHLLLRRDRLTLPDVLEVVDDARGRLRESGGGGGASDSGAD